MRSDKNTPESAVPQAPSDPPTALWGTEDISRLSLNDEEHDKSLVAADADNETNDKGNEKEESAISIRDPSGRPVSLRRSFIKRQDKSNLKPNPKYSEASLGTMSSTGLSGLTGLTNFTNLSSVAGISYATVSTASCSSHLAPETNTGNDIDPDVFNNSLFLEGQMLENTAVSDTSPTLSQRHIASNINTRHDVDSIGSKHSLYLDGHLSETYPKLDGSIQEKQISGSTCTPSMSTLRRSLLRKSSIGEGREYDSAYEGDVDLEDASLLSMRTDEMMSIRSKLSSTVGRKHSMHNSLDSLSYISGRMSICEHMSVADSGIFSMTEAELHDWHKEANEWEEDAEIEDDLIMEEEMQLHEDDCEEVNNMIHMPLMMNGTACP